MNESTREKLLKVALVAFGAIFFLIYPLGLIWPSGWVWHGGEGKYADDMRGLCGPGWLPDRRRAVVPIASEATGARHGIATARRPIIALRQGLSSVGTRAAISARV
jgi:hypothetical protein